MLEEWINDARRESLLYTTQDFKQRQALSQ